MFRLVLLACLALLTPTHADVVLSIDVDDKTPGIQLDAPFVPGVNLAASLFVTLGDASDQLGNYSFSVRFDQTELTFVDATEVDTSGLGFDLQFGNAAGLEAGNIVGSFEAAHLGPGAAAGPLSFQIGTVNFIVNAPTGFAGETDIEIGLFRAGFDAVNDGAGNMIAPVFQASSVSAVPEPSVFALFGLASGISWLRARAARSSRRRRLSVQGETLEKRINPGPMFNDVWQFNVETTDFEERVAEQLPIARKDQSAAAIGGKLFIFGGIGPDGTLADFWVFDAAEGKFLEESLEGSPPRPTSQAGATSIGDDFLIQGGNNRFDSTTRIFDTFVGIWSEVASFHPRTGLRGHTITLLKDKPTAFGGEAFNTKMNEVNELDLDSGTWRKVETNGDMPSGRSNAGFNADPQNNAVGHVVGGNGSDLQDVFEYNADTATFTQLADMPAALSDPGVASFVGDDGNSKILVFGGRRDGIAQDDAFLYDVPSDTWAILELSPENNPGPRFGHSLTTVNGVPTLFGGETNVFQFFSPRGNGADSMTLRVNTATDRLELLDDNTNQVLETFDASVSDLAAIRLFGAENEDDTITVDMSDLPQLVGGITLEGGDGEFDTLRIINGELEEVTHTGFESAFVADDIVPAVESIVVDDGSAQRSTVRSLTVSFNTIVELDADAFSLEQIGGAVVDVGFTTETISGKSVSTIVFSDDSTENGSLKDGNYRLTVHQDRVRVGSTAMSADAVESLFRFFGDVNGDRIVGLPDFNQFNQIFGLSDDDMNFDAAFDFNGDGVIGLPDFNELNQRFGQSLNPPI